ncbi:hypothetical protein GPECTOR_29g69 [Gonium pectorale]|uniref:phytol kinase n=1 Tax=Gonium pectorale TaxID=33097 RepID=A0A150GET4_GONPE|nr:hypothetical protein GPECTOR_29g69 [Gonium pectorale]|eukprot:KXZ48293.1 hypothetical protein GPECTOR_29g69 [Gonium pectorale]
MAGRAGRADAGVPDVADAGVPDVADAGVPDVADAGVPDVADAGVPDVADAGVPDVADAGVPDVADAGVPDVAAPLAVAEVPTMNRLVRKYAGALPALVYSISVTSILSTMPWPFDEEPLQREICAELVAALEDSRVLEHAAGAVLLQACNPRALHSMVPETVAIATRVHDTLYRLHNRWSRSRVDPDGTRLAGRLRAVASGRCVQHAARCIGLAVLCDADGGSAYGLPPEVLALLSSGQGPAGGEMSGGAVTQLRTMVCMMQLGDLTPPGRRGALALAMRVGWLAVGSARTQAAGEGGGGGSAGGGGASGSSSASPAAARAPPRPRRSVPREEVVSLAAEALHAAWHHLLLPRAVAHAAPAAAAAEAADWWQLAAAVVDRAVPCLTGSAKQPDLLSLGECLAVDWGLPPDCDVLSLPVEPPPALAVALDGGLLRCLERLMRRAGRDPQGPESRLLQGLMIRVYHCQSFWSYFAPLLAYGEPRQAAALLATLRKLLPTVDTRVLGAESKAADADGHDRLAFIFAGVLTGVLDAARAAVRGQAEVAAALAPGDEPPSPASQQLLSLLSFAACEWLPELSHCLLSRGVALPEFHSALLAWLPLLAGRCVVQPCAAADRSPTDDDTDGGANGSGKAVDNRGWRALLMEEVGAVPLLDASLRMVPRAAELRPDSRRPLLGSLVAACCAVAAVFLEAAGVEAPAAAAAAGPSGTTAAAVPVTPPLPWPSRLLREAAAGLRSCGDQDMAAQAEDLAAYLELGGNSACEALRQAPPPPGPLVSALPPPAEARRLLPGRCANPRCANLEGDSEADLTLKACAGMVSIAAAALEGGATSVR